MVRPGLQEARRPALGATPRRRPEAWLDPAEEGGRQLRAAVASGLNVELRAAGSVEGAGQALGGAFQRTRECGTMGAART